MKKITIWERLIIDKEKNIKEFRHNHIEDGHVEGDKPIPKFKSQNGWKSYIWRKTFGYLKGTTVCKA